jgi:hypothetical protein
LVISPALRRLVVSRRQVYAVIEAAREQRLLPQGREEQNDTACD